MIDNLTLSEILGDFRNHKHVFERFMNAVVDFFEKEPELNIPDKNIVHSIKCRLKNEEHLREKILRKHTETNPITLDNIYDRITDLAGVRVLHLYQDQFPLIHKNIIKQIENHDWVLVEDPIAYSWDPETRSFFSELGIRTDIKDSYYTSIHYLVRPNNDNKQIKCEIQVRTLFEEIWGEIDHKINYPEKCSVQSCREQIKVLSKLVSTGTRLADSIFRTYHNAN